MSQKLDFIKSVFGELKLSGSHHRANICPKSGCQGTGHVAIDSDESKNYPWNCKKCGASGNIFSLGYRDENAAKISTIDYLINRYRDESGKRHRLSSKTIENFSIEPQEFLSKNNKKYTALAIKENGLIVKKLIGTRWIACGNKNSSGGWYNIKRAANPQSKRVYIMAGEWDVFSFFDHTGINATTWLYGETPRKWQAKELDVFSGKEIIIIYDNDLTGRRGAESLASAIIRTQKISYIQNVNIGQLGLNGGGDVDDFFSGGGKKEILFDLIDKTQHFGISESFQLPDRETDPPNGDFGLIHDNAARLWKIGGLSGMRKISELESLAIEISPNEKAIRSTINNLNQTLTDMENCRQSELIDSAISENQIVLDGSTDPKEPMFFDPESGIYRYLSESNFEKLSIISNKIYDTASSSDKSIISRVKVKKAIKDEFLNRINNCDSPEFNRHPGYFAADNGVFKLEENGSVSNVCKPEEQIQKGFYFTGKYPYSFQYIDKKNRSESKIITALQKSVPEDSTFAILQKLAGITFFRHETEHIIWLVGSGGDGKSFFINALRETMFNYCSSYKIEDIIKKDFAAAGLHGKFLNTAPEVSTGSKPIESSLIKMLSGGDIISANRKNRSYISFRNLSKLWISSNETPKFSDNTHGISRRLIVIPFQQIKKEDQIPLLFENQIRGSEFEMNSFLSWIIDGYHKFLLDGIVEDDKTQSAKRDVRSSSDPVYEYWSDQLDSIDSIDEIEYRNRIFDVYNNELIIDNNIFYIADFKNWSERNGRGKSISSRKFTIDSVRAIHDIFNENGYDVKISVSENPIYLDGKSLNSNLFIEDEKRKIENNSRGDNLRAEKELYIPRIRRVLKIDGPGVNQFIEKYGIKYKIEPISETAGMF